MNDVATVVAKRLRRLSTAATSVSVILYGACLVAPAVRVISDDSTHADYPGLFALYFGYGWIFDATPAWLANPLLWGSWVSNLFSKYRAGLTLALISLVVALSFLTVDALFPRTKVERMLGYYLWMASILFTACAAGFADASRKYHGAISVSHDPGR